MRSIRTERRVPYLLILNVRARSWARSALMDTVEYDGLFEFTRFMAVRQVMCSFYLAGSPRYVPYLAKHRNVPRFRPQCNLQSALAIIADADICFYARVLWLSAACKFLIHIQDNPCKARWCLFQGISLTCRIPFRHMSYIFTFISAGMYFQSRNSKAQTRKNQNIFLMTK